MKYFLLLTLIACASRNKPPITDHKDELVHLSTVMDQIQFSYQKGCVDAYRDVKLGPSFETCRDKAKDHRLEMESILRQDFR